MRLDELLDGIETLDHAGVFPEMEVKTVTADSREAGPGSAFVAIQGEKFDGHSFIPDVLAAGATVIFQSQPLDHTQAGTFVRVADTRYAYALLCSRLAGNPSRRLRVIGVTGTNGKTSTTLILRHLLNSSGRQAAALGTLGLLRPGSTEFELRGLTTPEPGLLQRVLADLVEAGATHLAMEVSSHALAMHRVDGVTFAGGIFTNLTQDHLDYHRTLEEYKEAKALLFTRYLADSDAYGVFNADDPAGEELARRFGGIRVRIGFSRENNLVVSNAVSTANGLSWETVLKNGIWPASLQTGVNHAQFHSRLIGHYNIYNCLCAAGAALLEGMGLEEVIAGIASFPGVPGRLQRIENRAGLHVFVDYAHTPNAVENVLRALRGAAEPGRRVITVIGCGGDRDRGKRPLMGAAAQGASDLTIVTSDNPRSEDPDAIIGDILGGIDGRGSDVRVEPDRRRAIGLAIASAQSGDFVLIAGKGHEDYQILRTETIHFSDAEEAAAVLGKLEPVDTR
jgi:UDP-N-acetylmuramoyl-L-alanyl-D-glutamate--2,6-diaminopimelate ligase